MPKQRITKEMVVNAAFEVARTGENILVKSIAENLSCSVQPIYSYCENMEGLKQDVILLIEKYLNNFLSEHIDKNNMFESVGIAHAKFAKQEPYLYRLYFLRKRQNIASFSDLYHNEVSPNIAQLIANERGISLEQAKELHLNMIIFNIGISFVLTTLGEHTDINEVSKLLRNAHTCFSNI